MGAGFYSKNLALRFSGDGVEKLDLEKLVVVQRMPGGDNVVGESPFIYRKKTAERMMRGAEKRMFTIYTEDEYVDTFKKQPEENLTYAIKTYIKKIENNPIKNKKRTVCSKKIGDTRNELFGKDVRLYAGGRKNWWFFARDIVKEKITEEAKKRSVTVSGLLETILIQWLNKNADAQIDDESEFSPYAVTAYSLGRISNIEQEKFGYSDTDGYILNPAEKRKNIRRKLKQAGFLTEEYEKLFNITSDIKNELNEKQKIYFYAGSLGLSLNIFNV